MNQQREKAISKAEILRKGMITRRLVDGKWQHQEHASISIAKRFTRSVGVCVALTVKESLPAAAQ